VPRVRLRFSVLLVVLVVLVVVGCTPTATPPSFDPGTPCEGADQQQMTGAYPDLEATVPVALDGVAATSRASGRYCSRATLGSLVDAGIGEVHFGAGTWDRGSGKGISLVMYEAAGLTADNLFDSFLAAAAANAKVHDLKASQPTIDGQAGHRIDYLNGDSSFQRIVIWPADRAGRVRLLLAADLLDVELTSAEAAFH
jgi:hypothetical protein